MSLISSGDDPGAFLNGEDAVQVVRSLIHHAGTMYLRLGALLSYIEDERRDSSLPFDGEYVNAEFRLGYSKARYLIKIFQKFDSLGIDEDRLRGLKWSKAKEIARVPDDDLRDEFDDLVEFAVENTRDELINHITSNFEVHQRRTSTRDR